MIKLLTVIIRTLILYVFLTVGIRLMGKRQIGDMQPNELVITLVISEIAAIPLQDITQPLIHGVMAIFILVVLEIFISVIGMKSQFVRQIMSGQAVVVINNGIIDQKAMKNVRVTVDDLVELLRGQNVFDISTVAYAILEVNGDLSVMLKSGEQPLTAKDMNIKNEKETLTLPVISNGSVVNQSLKSLNITKKDLYKKLKKEKTEVKDVYLMTLEQNGKYTLVRKK